MAAAPPVAMVAPIQAELVGWAWPPVGSDTATKSASEPQVTAAAHQVMFADLLADPEAAQHEGEDQLGHQQGLDHRHLPVVQGEGLEDERPGQRHPAEQPQRVGGQVADEAPPLGVSRVADAGDVLRDHVQRVGERRRQREEDRDHGTAAPVGSAGPWPVLTHGPRCAHAQPGAWTLYSSFHQRAVRTSSGSVRSVGS